MAGHENSSTFGKSYAHPVCEIDGPATYFGITYGPTRAHTKSPWNGNVPLCTALAVPAKAEFEFQERSDILALDKTWRFL